MTNTGVTADAVRALRERTGAGVMDCKAALAEAGGDLVRAEALLRQRGKLQAAKKADRATGEGLVSAYVHSNQKLAVLVAVRCETDFVARSAPFQQFARDLAMQVAATDPLSVRAEDLPPDAASDRALLEQPFVKDPALTVTDLVAAKIAELGENIVIERFVRVTL
jgi:elongation factor Ts